MSRPKKRTENGRLTKEAAEIVVEMLNEDVVQGRLRQANDGWTIAPTFSQDISDGRYPYEIGDVWFTGTLTYYPELEDPRDIVGFDHKADRKEFKRRWRERYPKEAKPETQVETQVKTHSESEIKLIYPLFAKSRANGAIILFTSQNTGVCLFNGVGSNRYAEWDDAWRNAADTDHWQHLTFAEAEAEIFGEKK